MSSDDRGTVRDAAALRVGRSGDQRGFTIMELIVVVVILGVLSVVVAVSVSQPAKNSKTSTCRIEARQVQAAEQAYAARYGKNPPNVGALIPEFLDQAPVNVFLDYGYSPPMQWNTQGPAKCTPGQNGLPQFP